MSVCVLNECPRLFYLSNDKERQTRQTLTTIGSDPSESSALRKRTWRRDGGEKDPSKKRGARQMVKEAISVGEENM